MKILIAAGFVALALAAPVTAQFPRLPRGAEKAMRPQGHFRISISPPSRKSPSARKCRAMVQFMTVFITRPAVAYVRKVGATVAAQAERKDVKYNFASWTPTMSTAFAITRRLYLRHRGLLENIHNEGELAGVLGHEVGHVAGRHAISQIKTMKGIRLAGDTAKAVFLGASSWPI